MAKHSRDFEPGEFPALDGYLPGQRPPLEAQLIDLADEIAYNTSDLDDGFAAGLFTAEDVAAAVPRYAELAETIEMQFPGATERERFFEVLRLLLDGLVTGFIQGTVDAASGVASVEDVRRHPTRLARLTEPAAVTNRELKAFLHARVYNSPLLCEERARSSGMIAWMFQYYLDHPAGFEEPLHRSVCDYIAGMTDPFFLRTYQRLK
jgi:dGTPase